MNRRPIGAGFTGPEQVRDRSPRAALVLTGGGADIILGDMSWVCHHHRDLVLQGLHRWSEVNA